MGHPVIYAHALCAVGQTNRHDLRRGQSKCDLVAARAATYFATVTSVVTELAMKQLS